MGWQDLLVGLIVAAALVYLGSRFRGPKKAVSKRPDVAVGSLVRRDRTRP